MAILNLPTRLRLRLSNAALLGLCIGILGVGVSLIPFVLEQEERVGLHWLFQLRGVRHSPPEVVIVAMDKQSSDELNLPNNALQWPRSIHARLLNTLSEAGVSVIAFDIFFRRPQDDADDQLLADAIKKAGNVVLAAEFERDRSETKYVHSPPLYAFAENALASTPFPLPTVPLKLGQFWAFKAVGGESDRIPTLPVVVLQAHALQSYEVFIGWLREIRPQFAAGLPPTRLALRQQSFTDVMLEIRRIMKKDPSIVEQLLEKLTSPELASMASSDRSVLSSLVHAYAGANSHYLNYYGPPGTVTTIPYHQVTQELSGKSIDLKGKIVFVGFSERQQLEQRRDHHPFVFSPRSGLNLSGVEVAATALANLLQNNTIKPVDMPSHLAIVLLWGFLVGCLLYFLQPLYSFITAFTAGSLYLWLSFHEFQSSATWLPILVPLFWQLPIAVLGGTLWNYARIREEKVKLEKAFTPHFRDAKFDRLASQVMAEPDHTELVYAACIHTDIAGYTSLSENMDQRELAGIMHQYFAMISEQVRNHGGHVSDERADGSLAMWATPKRDIESVAGACQAALALATAIEQFNAIAEQQGRPALPTRIGVHAGDVALGNVDGEVTPFSDILNSAQRIEYANKDLGTKILVSEEVLENLSGFVTRKLGTFRTPGKRKLLVLYELMGLEENLDARQTRLIQAFGQALTLFTEGDWDAAAKYFQRILEQFPTDGPARVLLERSLEFATYPPVGESTHVIDLSVKA